LSERDDNDQQEGSGGRPGMPIDPLRLWHALRGGWQIIAVATIIGAFIGAAIAKKVVTQSFASRAVMRWETTGTIDPIVRQTVVESVTLPSNLDQVKKKMKLALPSASLVGFVTVSSSANSNHVSIDANWASSQGAADLANTMMDVFLENRVQAERQRLDAEVKRHREAVADAERRQIDAAAAYEKFRKENGISDISAERQKVIDAAATLSAQSDAAKAQALAAKEELDKMGGSGNEPEGPAMSRQLTEADRAQADSDLKRLPAARSELNSARVQFTDEHPTVRRLLAEIDALERRIKARGSDDRGNSARRAQSLQERAAAAASRQKAAEQYQAQLKERLDKLSAVEGQAAVLLGENRVAEKTLNDAKSMLSAAELAAANPPQEFRVLERATPPEFAVSSPRRRVALGVPAVFGVLALLGVIVWNLRKLDVVTPKEAAFWANVPVIGASTWPRDPDMLSSLMHDLDDFAPNCEGVTLIVGVSLEEAHLARRVAEWDGHRMPKAYDPQKLLASGMGANANALAIRNGEPIPRGEDSTNMQILTLTGPVPAQALRRAGRMADRVLVVVTAGKHSLLQLMKIKNRLGRENGIGILLVGLPKDYAMVRDRVGEVERFWHATRVAG
jgi:uncharacterized protein involved in exopolysaccharide biosynthesis